MYFGRSAARTDSNKLENRKSLGGEKCCGPKSRMRRCFLWFLRELSNFHQLIPTQEGSMGWDDQTFLSLGQSRTANGLAFDFTKPLSPIGQSRTSRGQAFDFVCHEFRVELCELGNFCLVPSTQEGSIGVENETFFSLGQSRTGGGQDHAPSWPDSCSWCDWRSMESVSRFSITQF